MDLNEALRLATLRNEWDESRAEHVLGRIQRRINGSVIDWDRGIERWARVLCKSEVCGYLCVRVPIAFAVPAVSDAFRDDRVVLVSVADFSAQVYSVDKHLVTEVFGGATEVLDYSRISINDLWYATVT